jgi:hypothetical protein
MAELPLIVFDVNETLLDLDTMAPTDCRCPLKRTL